MTLYLQQLSFAFQRPKMIGQRINKDLLVSYKTVCNPWEPCGSTEKVIPVLSSSIKKLSKKSSEELCISEERQMSKLCF